MNKTRPIFGVVYKILFLSPTRAIASTLSVQVPDLRTEDIRGFVGGWPRENSLST